MTAKPVAGSATFNVQRLVGVHYRLEGGFSGLEFL